MVPAMIGGSETGGCVAETRVSRFLWSGGETNEFLLME
jgi:hypothetical protein